MAKISIVTIVKDHAKGLSDTFSSLTNQSFQDWEMIIVVGESRDLTLTTAQNLKLMDVRVRVITQTGLGIYTAMNEGTENARGEFIWFMNAGDEFAGSEVLESGFEAISVSDVGLVIGGWQIQSKNRYRVFSYSPRKISTLYFAFSRRGGCHQAMIFRTDQLRELGGYISSYRLANDFELILRVIKCYEAIRVPQVYATVEPGGVSQKGIFLVHTEKNQIRRAFFRSRTINLMSLVWTFAAKSKLLFRQILNAHN